MRDKTAERKFTIQFNRTDPLHLQVADILNQQERGAKAQFIVNAVLHYIDKIDNNGLENSQQKPQFDEKLIESVVKRILRERDIAGNLPAISLANQDTEPILPEVEVVYDNSLEALGTEGLDLVAHALEMFRNK
jgi:hypothetical protein